MRQIRSMIAVVACVVTGASLATLLISNLYVTRLYQPGIFGCIAFGILAIAVIAATIPGNRWAHLLYLCAYVIMTGSFFLALQVSILILAHIKIGVELKSISLMVVATLAFFSSRILVKRLNQRQVAISARE
jgi:hypothetical protein